MSQEIAVEEFRKQFGGEPDIVAVAPGRINLIGEHTDYNEGYVFPGAIDRFAWVAARVSKGASSRLVSAEMGPAKEFDAATTVPKSIAGWGAYAAGMAWVLRENGFGDMPNVEAVVSSEVPIESGLSSSAALELAFGVMWLRLAAKEMPMPKLAQLAQLCENQFVGVNSGIMDQMASAMGKAGRAMFLDTRNLQIRYAQLPAQLSVVVCDTKKPRALLDSAYNERRAQCQEACRVLGVKALRDADMLMLDNARARMDPVVYRRARHVITENARCVLFAEALDEGDLNHIGVLMRGSHESLRDDYQVSCFELDQMAEACWDAPGCVGARMTGAGFGGACVALVETAELDKFTRSVLPRYRESTGLDGAIIPCKLAEGAHVVVSAA